MLPPEIAMTWYVPASCSRRSTSSSRPARSPMRIADTMAAERSLHGATLDAIARRTAARIAATRFSQREPPTATTSTSLSLLTDPTSDDAAPRELPLAHRARPGFRYLVGLRSVAGNRTRRPARHCENLIAPELSADADERAAGRSRYDDAVQLDAIDRDAQRDARRPSCRVGAQAPGDDRRTAGARRRGVSIEERAQRRLPRPRHRHGAPSSGAARHETRSSEAGGRQALATREKRRQRGQPEHDGNRADEPGGWKEDAGGDAGAERRGRQRSGIPHAHG